jgi:transposase
VSHLVQIILALVVDSQGLPIAYEVFKGNFAETKTLIPILEKLRYNRELCLEKNKVSVSLKV